MGSSSSPGISSKKKKKKKQGGGEKENPPLMLSSGPPSLLLPATPETPAVLHLYPRDAEVMLIKQTAVGSTLAINQAIREVMDLWYITRAINFRSNASVKTNVENIHLGPRARNNGGAAAVTSESSGSGAIYTNAKQTCVFTTE